MPILNCLYFNGYKPCGRSSDCSESCSEKKIYQTQILLIHLGALGAVVRSTSLLRSIHRKYPEARISWVTDTPADQLLSSHPSVHEVLTTKAESLLALQGRFFDVAFVIDKSLKAAGLLSLVRAQKIFGFQRDPQLPVMIPATKAAQELWEIGLSDEKKFFENDKSEIQLMLEALELKEPSPGRTRDIPDYWLPLTEEENRQRDRKKMAWAQNPNQILVGINTGCGPMMSAKKLTVEYQRELIVKIYQEFGSRVRVVLLGGPEDTLRNEKISFGLDVISSQTRAGLREGLTSIAACDLILTGDSLGMHMGISQKKYVIAWFGPSCAHEIEFYGRGEALMSESHCSPCWKRDCQKPVMCYDQLPAVYFINAMTKYLNRPLLQGPKLTHSELPSAEIFVDSSD